MSIQRLTTTTTSIRYDFSQHDSIQHYGALNSASAADSNYFGLDNFSGALLGLRLSPLLITSANQRSLYPIRTHQTPDEISDCFAQAEHFLHSPQAFIADFPDSNSIHTHPLLAIALPLLRYCHDDFSQPLQRLFTLLSAKQDTAYLVPAYLALADALSVSNFRVLPELVRQPLDQAEWLGQASDRATQYGLSTEQKSRYDRLWQAIFVTVGAIRNSTDSAQLPSTQLPSTQLPTEQERYRSVIWSISSALVQSQNYVHAVLQAAKQVAQPEESTIITPALTGLIVGNWIGPSAIPLLLQLQIDTKTPLLSESSPLQTESVHSKETLRLLSRTYCQTIARALFDQWSGYRCCHPDTNKTFKQG